MSVLQHSEFGLDAAVENKAFMREATKRYQLIIPETLRECLLET